jgi:hypothetical protein
MAKQCPECHTINVDSRVARCGSCGCQLLDEKFRLRWEDRISPYLAIAVGVGLLIALILVGAWFFQRAR